MKIEEYVLSKICHSKESAVWAMIRLKPEYFTGANRKLFTLIISLYKIKQSVDLHVLASQYAGQGGDPKSASDIYHYCYDYSDQWENVFEEFRDIGLKKQIQVDVKEIFEATKNGYSPLELASMTVKKSSSWITQTERRYFSGSEIDQLGEQYGEPIKTGFPIYDENIYKHGGNLKGQMKGVICRQKHGKTRSACWEVAQNIRMGYKVLYLTMESTKKRIRNNVAEVLQADWKKYRDNIFVVDGYRSLDDLIASTVEAVLVEGIDKVVIDYIQLAVPSQRYSSENEKINICIQEFRHLMIRYNFHCVILSQARKNQNMSVPKYSDGEAMFPSGWKYVPRPEDAYGSQELINACTILDIGFRPSAYPENIIDNGLSKKVINPLKREDSYFSLYFQIALIRDKPEFLYQWWRFTDSDSGLQNPQWI